MPQAADLNHLLLARSRLDAAIIDLDGTLVDTLGDFVAALNLMLQELAGRAGSGVPKDQVLTTRTIEAMVGKGSEHLVLSVLRHVLKADSAHAGRVTALYPAAMNLYQQHYRQINGRFSSLYPGVAEGLAALDATGLRLACLTNKPLAFAQDLLQAKGLAGYFSHVYGGDSFERKKPDPLPLLKTCEALGTPPARTLMVGDSSNDAEAARAAQCPVVLVTYGYNHGKPIRGVDADGWIDSLAELPRLWA